MRTTILLVALLAAALSGCVDEAEPTPADSPSNVVTDPLDYSYLDNETDDGSHVHDYWNGQDTLPVAGRQTTINSRCSGCGEGSFEVMSVRPPSGSIVPQGAAFVDLTFTWTESEASRYDGAELWIKTAADAEAQRAGAILSGETFRFNSTNEQNDPPHHVLSLWVFELHFTGGDEIIFEGDIAMEATATRGLEIPPWPAHPDHWKGATELTIIDRDGSVFWYDRYELNGGTSSSCYIVCELSHAPDEGVIVPPQTGHVAVELSFEPGAIPTGIGLAYHGADTWDMQPLEPVEAEPLRWVYEIPIEPGRHDSPYALQSLWQFQLFLDQPTPAQAWHGDYHITVTAIKA